MENNKKILTIEYDEDNERLELHLNKQGALFLKHILDTVVKSDASTDFHLISPEWGGEGLSAEKQNLSETTKLLHHLKIFYWTK